MKRVGVDRDEIRRGLAGTCFICEMVSGNPEYAHHVVYENQDTIVFVDKYPTLYGYVLVAPKEHREQATGDFTREEYLRLQDVVYRVGEAIRNVVLTERLYVLSLGSQQANRHVHWHVAPLPPDVPFEEQQLRALGGDEYLELSSDEAEHLVRDLRAAIAAQGF